MKSSLKLYLITEYAIFLALFFYLYQYARYDASAGEIIFFIFILFFASNLSTLINTGKDIITSINIPILMTSMVLLGPFWTAIVAFLGTIKLRQVKDYFIWYQFIFNRAVFFIAAGVAGLVFDKVNIYFNSYFIPFFLAASSYFIINSGLVYFVVKIANSYNSSLLIYYFKLSKNLISSFFIGLVFYYGYILIGKTFFILAIILIYILKDFLFSHIQQLNSFTQIVESFLKVIDSKDHYTEGHCERVARYTEMLCKEMRLGRGKTERIVNMAKIHDIGKIYVDDSILKSSDILTNDEYEEMKNHSRYGYELLQDIDLMRRDLSIILYHHEHYDGNGYPEGKQGNEIPLGARILGICDAFDVMISGRDYKPALTKNEIILELENCSGKQFDPDIVIIMINMIKKGLFDSLYNEKDSQKNTVIKQPSMSFNSKVEV